MVNFTFKMTTMVMAINNKISSLSSLLVIILPFIFSRHWSENEMISIIRFRNALFGDALRHRSSRQSTRSTQVLVEPSTFDNPAFLQPQTIEEVSTVF